MGLVAGSKKTGTGRRVAALLIFIENIGYTRTGAKCFTYVLSLSLPKNHREIVYRIVGSA